MSSHGFSSLEVFLTLFSLLSGMGKKRGARAIDFDLDCNKVNEALERRKKKKSSKAQLSGKTLGVSSARTRGIEDPSVVVGTISTVANRDDVELPHLICMSFPLLALPWTMTASIYPLGRHLYGRLLATWVMIPITLQLAPTYAIISTSPCLR